MDFVRQESVMWRRDVPGARWFKADLHVHTIDDHPGRRAKFPAGVNGPPGSEKTIADYARRFLQGAVRQGVRVLGVTPHSPRAGEGPETSAVWRIVEEWNGGIDDDGQPFRDKLFAVFPGFEPSFKQGRAGLHLLFLFDPEIGRDRYLKAFDLAMGGASPWRGNELQLSNRNAEEAFRDLREFHRRESPKVQDGGHQWSYIVLAPHIENEKGLLGAQKAQVLELFQHGEVAGLELGDEKLPEDTVKGRAWLREGMAEHRQAFFHGSDAYSVDDVGKRHTWLKLASPRIEALRQAFIAHDSRMRIAYERQADGSLSEIPDPPDVTVSRRPWLKSVTIAGGASFFRADDDRDESECRFELSPDLTCIIGGSMTGKSTFLDGLRVHVKAPMPSDDGLRGQVEARGKDGFLAGSPAITLDCSGGDPTAPHHQRWPAVFHAQNELQRLTQEPGAVEDILARLVLPVMGDIQEREKRLNTSDGELRRAAKRLADLYEDLADAEQACERSGKAAEDIAAFADAGIEELHCASRDLRCWQEFAERAKVLAGDLDRIRESAEALDLPENDGHLADVLRAAGVDEQGYGFRARWERIRDHLRSVNEELAADGSVTGSVLDALAAHERVVRGEVDRKLAALGLDGARIREFQALNRQAALLASYAANLEQVRVKLADAERAFRTLLADRRDMVYRQRHAFDRVIETVSAQFDGRISARRIDDGNREPLERFLKELKQKGITRWWNDLPDDRRPSSARLLEALEADRLAWFGMSEAVQVTFRECLSVSKQRELAAIRCRDRYLIELRMDDGSYRRLDDLSGGQRVSVLLSLLLETNDDRPLVIDQPEDELDNRFLFETVLPALKRLKGRRQIVVATHNPNIVVNGDADQVIQLEATANRGRVARAGAIEEPAVRDAIVRTVDGGDEAFRLRRLKYGF